MAKNQTFLITLATLAAVVTLVNAQDTPPAKAPADGKTASSTNAVPKPAAKQADVASKTAKFASVSKTSDLYKNALDAHALDKAITMVDKEGAFKGTVAKIFEPRGGAMAILNFDENYRNALTALLRKDSFDKFPALTNLVTKEVVVTGKFIDYHGHAEIVLTNVTQIKLVQ
jgi:hypothetical protein